MTIEELLLEIKKIPIAMINFDDDILDNLNDNGYNIDFLKHKLQILKNIYDIFISDDVQEYINPSKIRMVCQDLEHIIDYINNLIDYLTDLYNSSAELYNTLKDAYSALYCDNNMTNNDIKIKNYKMTYDDTLYLMELYMNDNHENFKNMYITNMNISDVLYQPAKK